MLSHMQQKEQQEEEYNKNHQQEYIEDQQQDEDDEDHYDYMQQQSKQERSQLRQFYRKEMAELEQNAENFIHSEDAEELIYEKLQSINQLFSHVRHSEDAAMDSKLLIKMADISLRKTKNMRFNSSVFDMDEFLLKLKWRLLKTGYRQNESGSGSRVDDAEDDGIEESYDTSHSGNRRQTTRSQQQEERDSNNSLNWFNLKRQINRCCHRRVNSMDFMLGPLSIQEKKRKERMPHKRMAGNNTEKMVQPKELRKEDVVQQNNSNETTQNVILIGRYLAKFGRINFFKFIINPESFSQSVENLFYLSFHIRDGRAKIEFDQETNEPMLELLSGYSNQNGQQEHHGHTNNKLKKKQLVIDLDMKTWKDAIEIFGIQESMIPTRESTANGQIGSNKWYG